MLAAFPESSQASITLENLGFGLYAGRLKSYILSTNHPQ